MKYIYALFTMLYPHSLREMDPMNTPEKDFMVGKYQIAN